MKVPGVIPNISSELTPNKSELTLTGVMEESAIFEAFKLVLT